MTEDFLDGAGLEGRAPADVIAALAPRLGPDRSARLDEVARGRLVGVEAVLDDLRDPHNGGAALRSCESMGVLPVHVIARHHRFRTSARVTQGAEKWLSVRRWREPEAAIADLRARGVRLFVGLPPSVKPAHGVNVPLADLDVARPIALAFGNEHTGLSPELLAAADGAFSIPMHGFSQSLNVSVSVAIGLHVATEARRRLVGRAGDLDDAQLERLRARYYALDVRGWQAIVDRSLATRERGG